MMTETSTRSAAMLWPEAPLPGTIELGEVHVWAWGFPAGGVPQEADLQLLDSVETARTWRFYFTPDRVRYSVCHATMRRILSSYLHRPPQSLAFERGSEGKPRLVGEPPLCFNLSHSKTVALLAVATGTELGVDVEDIRPIESRVAERHFSPVELAKLAQLRGQEWLDGFYRCWTRKEAVLKAEGVGLRIPLDSFDVSLLSTEPAALLAARREAGLTADWNLHHLAAAPGCMGAVAVAHACALVRTYTAPAV